MDDLTAIKRSLQLLVLISLFVTAYFAKDLLLPILLGFLLALTLSPLVRSARRLGIAEPISASVLIGIAGLAVLLVVGGSASTIALWSDEFPSMSAEIQRKLSGMADTVETMRKASEEVSEIGSDDAKASEVVVKQPGFLDNALSAGTKITGTIAVSLLLALFLLGSGDLFYLKLVQSFQTLTGKKRALRAVHDVERRVSRYLLTITLINAGLGVAVATYLAALGLPAPYVWGVVAFLLNFLPYIGGIMGAFLAGAYALVTFDSVGFALMAPIGYLILTSFEGQIVTPYLIGRRLEINTVAVFLTVVFWAWLWGIAGALIAVPFLVVLKVICENVTDLAVVGNFLDTTRPDEGEPQAEEA
ncbi:MAG: AI-2E family transporter [Sulfitobacter sp.]